MVNFKSFKLNTSNHFLQVWFLKSVKFFCEFRPVIYIVKIIAFVLLSVSKLFKKYCTEVVMFYITCFSDETNHVLFLL